MKTKILLLVVAGLAGAGGGWLFTETVLKDDPVQMPLPDAAPTASELIGQARPDFTLGSTTGEILNASDFDGDVLLINFWATWCAPCREEMPMLSELHETRTGQGVQCTGNCAG